MSPYHFSSNDHKKYRNNRVSIVHLLPSNKLNLLYNNRMQTDREKTEIISNESDDTKISQSSSSNDHEKWRN